MLKRWLLVAVLSVALSMMFFVGCDNDDDPGVGPDDPDDSTAANLAVQQGNEILADVLFEMINTEPEEISDVDITEAYGYYEDAIAADADHPGGHFGMGMLEVFTLTQDEETQQFFDNMEEYWSGDTWFLEEGDPAPFANSGAYGKSGVSYIIAGPSAMMTGMTQISEEYGYSVGDMQQFVRDKLLPLVTSAIDHLLVVVDNDDFVFMVTGEMQGDLNEDDVELDLTEVHATIAALSSLEALLEQFVAYNLDLGDFTSADMLEAFTQDSDFLSLESDGTARMQSALAAWTRAANHIDDGLTFLKNEVDDQTNDFIRIDPYDGIPEEDIEEIEEYLAQVLEGLAGTTEVEFEIDGEPIMIDMSAYDFFMTPVQNVKALLPAYTVELDLDPTGWPDWEDMVFVEDGEVLVSITVTEPGYYYWNRYGTYFRGDEFDSGSWGDDVMPELDEMYDSKVAQYADQDYVDIYMYLSAYLEVGTTEAFVYVSVMTGEVPYRYVPVFTWEADNGDDWIFPDPTFGGLLPGMTDDEFKELIDWSTEDFEQTVTLHIWEMIFMLPWLLSDL